jgi:hypothetical protein
VIADAPAKDDPARGGSKDAWTAKVPNSGRMMAMPGCPQIVADRHLPATTGGNPSSWNK